MKAPDISVIMPFHNAERYIGKAIESILKSNYEGIELIAVDDGSLDGSARICLTFAKKDERVRLVRNEGHGVSAARNTGINLARGEFIAFADADDEVCENMYSNMLRKAREERADIVQCAVVFKDGNKEKVLFSPRKDTIYECGDGAKVLKKYFSHSCWSKIYRKSSLGHIRFDETISVGEDLYYNLFAMSVCKRAVFLKEAHYKYVQQRTSVMNTLIESCRLDSLYTVLKRARNSFESFPDLSVFIDLAIIKNIAHVLSLTAGKNSRYCKEMFAKNRNLAKNSLPGILFFPHASLKNKLSITLAVLTPKIYEAAVLRKRKYEGKST